MLRSGGTCFLPPRRTAGFSTPQDCPLRYQSCYGRNDNEGGVSQYYAKLNSKHYVTPFAESVLLAERDEVQRVAEARSGRRSLERGGSGPLGSATHSAAAVAVTRAAAIARL